jgi:hypothetical protein
MNPVLEQQKNELDAARKVNEAKVERVHQLPVASFSLLPDRIDAVLEFLIPTEIDGELNPDRLAFELRWETAVGKFLDAVIAKGEEHEARSKLVVAQAVPPSNAGRPPLHIPGQR